MERKHWTLLAVAAADGGAVTPVQLQKSLFILQQEMPDAVGSDYYDFEPYNYGPFDPWVYHDAEALASEGLLHVAQVPPSKWNRYSATDAGLGLADRLRGEAPDASAYLERVMKWARGLSFSALVRAVYRKYPDTKENSIFMG